MLKIYNTLTRKKEEFVPLEKGKVKMFVCGQTVYDDAHLGHAKTYINFDVIVRWLRYIGYNVFYVQNITDIDDKIIKRANERGISFKELAEFYIKRFFEDMEALGVKQNINLFPKSSEFIPQIAEQIQALIDKGY
ncbi:MAG: class I tRNA ligase family protein, partial [Candidatus Aenigmatarchaeota archaeon]